MPGPDDLAERLHRLLERRRLVVAVALVEIDVVGLQAEQRGIDLLQDLRPRQPTVAVAHREVELRGEHVRVARPGAEHLAEELLRRAATVDVRGVDEVDPELEGAIDAGDRPVALDATAERQPGAERDLGDVEVARAEAAVLHRRRRSDRLSGRSTPPRG